MDQHLPVRGQSPTPSVWRRAVFIGLRVGGGDLVLADPVVEAEIRVTAQIYGEVDEELIGFHLVDEVEAAGESVLGALD